jgi:hypothetical protein
LLEIRTEELLKYRNFTFSAISKAYMSNKSDKEFREWFKDESARILPSSIGGR